MLFNEGADDFFVDFHGTREADCFTCQPLDAGAEGQVVTFNTLREDFAGQMFLLWHFSGVAVPVIAWSPCRYRTESTGLTVPDRSHHSVARKSKPTHHQF